MLGFIRLSLRIHVVQYLEIHIEGDRCIHQHQSDILVSLHFQNRIRQKSLPQLLRYFPAGAVLYSILFPSQFLFGSITVVEEEQGQKAYPEVDFQEFFHVNIGIDKFDDSAFPSLWRGKVQETEYGHLDDQNPEKYRVNKLYHLFKSLI
jgi:hypothetical protein